MLVSNKQAEGMFDLDFIVLFYSVVIESNSNGSATSNFLKWIDWNVSKKMDDHDWCELLRRRLIELRSSTHSIDSFKGSHIFLLTVYCDRLCLMGEMNCVDSV